MNTQELYDELAIQKATFNYKNNLMWFKAYWLPFIFVAITLGIQLWMKDTFLIFLYSMVTTVFGLVLYGKYKTVRTSKNELHNKLEHNRKFIEKHSQFEEDKLNFFKT